MRVRKSKTIRKTAITIVVLVIIFMIVGAAYVYVSDRSNVKPPVPTTKPEGVPADLSPTLKSVQPGANAPEGVSIQFITSPVAVGSNASINIGTLSGSACTILVTYNNVPSKDSGLTPKVADTHGSVSWTWTVDKSVPIGKWPVKVTCVYHGRSGIVIGDLEVTKSAPPVN